MAASTPKTGHPADQPTPPRAGALVRPLPLRLDAAARTGSCRARLPQPGIVIAPPRYALAHALTRSLGAPLTSGNRIELLGGGEPVRAALFDAIDRSREHINLASPGRVEPALAAALAQRLMARSAAGVRVNLLLDGSSSRHGAADAAVLRQAGVSVCTLRRGGWRGLPQALGGRPARCGRSLTVIDGRLALLGGLAPPWADIGARGASLRVQGPAVALLQQLFIADWRRERGEALPPARYFPALRAEGRQRAALALPGAERPGAFPCALLAAIEAARQHVLLSGAADAEVAAALAGAARRGIEVHWLMPAGAAAPPADRARQRSLHAAGVRLQRRRHGALLGEACVIDGVWAAAATLPLAPHRQAAEAALIVLDEAFGAGVERLLRDDMALGRELAADDLGDAGEAPRGAGIVARGWRRLCGAFGLTRGVLR